MAVINDADHKNSCEFRVALSVSEKKDDDSVREKYVDTVLNKWKNFSSSGKMYVIGSDTEADPAYGDTIYTHTPAKDTIKSKAEDGYTFQLCQNYVSGKPYNINMQIYNNDNENIFIFGDTKASRDINILNVIIKV